MPIPKEKRNTNGFAKNKQNINRNGANRKLVSSVMFEFEQLGLEEVTPAQVKSVFAYLLNLKISELEEITKDKSNLQ